MTDRSLPRRSLVATAAWGAPAILVASAAPAFASSMSDLRLTAPASAAVHPNTSTTVDFTVTNVGTEPTTGPVTVNVPRPASNSGTITAGALPAGWTVSGTGSALTLTSTSPMAVGATATLPVVYNPPGNGPVPSTLGAQLTARSGGDINAANDAASTQLLIPDLKVTVTLDKTMVSSGQSFFATYEIRNVGSRATNPGFVQIAINVPPGVTSGEVYGWPTDWTRAFGYGYRSPSAFTLAPNAFVLIRIKWTGVTAPLYTPINVTGAVVGFAGGEVNETNNTGTASVQSLG